MNPWLETLCVILVALLGVLLGWAFSRLRQPYWISGYLISLLLIAVLVTARFANPSLCTSFFDWLTATRAKFVLLSLAATIGITTPFSRLPHKFEKLAVSILLAIVVTWFSVLPFLVPALIKDYLSNLKTRIDPEGNCFQSTNYTCGPAAAVTALGKLGIQAQEGQIAILAHTSPIAGTLPQCLSSALNNRYGPAGLKCQYRHFDSISQLKDAEITLAVVKDRLLSNHCVAVLKVSDHSVLIADPVFGNISMSHKQFEKMWLFAGIVLKRDSFQNI